MKLSTLCVCIVAVEFGVLTMLLVASLERWTR